MHARMLLVEEPLEYALLPSSPLLLTSVVQLSLSHHEQRCVISERSCSYSLLFPVLFLFVSRLFLYIYFLYLPMRLMNSHETTLRDWRPGVVEKRAVLNSKHKRQRALSQASESKGNLKSDVSGDTMQCLFNMRMFDYNRIFTRCGRSWY